MANEIHIQAMVHNPFDIDNDQQFVKAVMADSHVNRVFPDTPSLDISAEINTNDQLTAFSRLTHRKRNLSDTDLITEITQDHEVKKSRHSKSVGEQVSSVEHRLMEMMNTLSSSLSNLSTELANVCKSLTTRMVNLENNLDKKWADKIQIMVHDTVRDEVAKTKGALESDMRDLTEKVKTLECSYADVCKKTSGSLEQNIVIRNLPFDNRENEFADALRTKLEGLFRDGVKVYEIDITSSIRKESMSDKPGVVIVTLGSVEQKRKIMRNKRNLMKSQRYDRVYIEHDNPVEIRRQNSNLRTILKACDQNKQYTVKNGRLIPNTAGTDRVKTSKQHENKQQW